MTRYQYEEHELKLIEDSTIPCIVYQYIDEQFITIALSQGFCQLMHLGSLKEAYEWMEKDRYRVIHPDDRERVIEAGIQFATIGTEYDVLYRAWIEDEYVILHAIGFNTYRSTGERLAVVYYVPQGTFKDQKSYDNGLHSLKIFQMQEACSPLEQNYDATSGLIETNDFLKWTEAKRSKDVESGRPGYYVFFNLSGMKGFNINYGFAEGDRLLQAFGKLLLRYFAKEHCCRLRVDHFVAYTDDEEIEADLKRFVVDAKSINNGKNLPVRIGVYPQKSGWIALGEAVDRAKIACDFNKNEFESTINFFNQKMMSDYKKKRYILENLDHALEAGWIQVYYQPIVRTVNEQVCDEEALARWVDPTHGLIPPDEFISILEEAKITYKLDLHVVDCVVKKLKEQQEQKFYLFPNSINLSRSDFFACDIVEEVDRRVQEAGIDRSMINVELTESYLADNLEYILTQVERFQSLGYQVWLDDFGSGYASPDLLTEIPFDVVKIDKKFVDKIDSNEKNRVLVTEFIRLASSMGSDTVAEGVETREQVEFLKEAGCSRMQGYNYSRPIPVDHVFEQYRTAEAFQIENPLEAEYYSAIGKLDLLDIPISFDTDNGTDDIFNAIPMFVEEVKGNQLHLVRTNRAYRDFMAKFYSNEDLKPLEEGFQPTNFLSENILNMIQDKLDGQGEAVDVRNYLGDVIHTYIRRISKNPVNGAVAISVAIFGREEGEKVRLRLEENERIAQERRSYNRIMALYGDVLVMSSVDPVTNHFVRYSSKTIKENMDFAPEGDNFYETMRKKAADIIYIEDMDLFLSALTKENVMREIRQNGVFSLSYRQRINGVPRYVCLKATLVDEPEGQTVIFGLMDTDAQVKKDEEYTRKLMAARDIANLDSLTGVKNKFAYADAESRMDVLISAGAIPCYAVAVFDVNGLKEINDTKGHQAGDKYIIEGCHMICNIFKHSPIFRIGGDEFTSIIQGEDYEHINDLMNELQKRNEEHAEKGKVVVAAGVSRCRGDKKVAVVFKRADAAMYKNKKQLKEKQEKEKQRRA